MNLGEELVATYLEHIEGCNFIQQNVYTPDVQGEIDVIGIKLDNPKSIYVCEVAVHLTTGLRYVKEKQPNNVNKLFEKFSKDIKYTKKFFPGYDMHFMLWSPIVKSSKEGSKHNQSRDLEELQSMIFKEHEVELECIVNEKFYECMGELRAYAKQKTEELRSPVLRLMQIEEYLKAHIGI
ncbi:hypothetical protein GMSM_29660 [Geomonas sp. Red276]